MVTEPASRGGDNGPPVRSILRVVITVVCSFLALYLLYLLREPIGWIALAAFLAVAASGPINVLSRHMKRGLAITVVYGSIVLVPLGLAVVLLPSLINATVDLVNDLPGYINELEDELEKSEWFAELNQKYDVTQKLTELAEDLVGKLGAAAGALADIGAGVIGSLFAGVTILVLSIFMAANSRRWLEAILRRRDPEQAEALGRLVDRVAGAVGGYIIGALLQATVAGAAAFLMLWILGVPSPLALAIVVALFDLIPMVGATLAAVLVGVVTLFADFPVDTIIWAVFAIAYQQFENYVIQPQIQKRTVSLEPLITLVAVLFGGTLLGVIGAVIAIPIAATIKVAIEEWGAHRERHAALPEPNPSG